MTGLVVLENLDSDALLSEWRWLFPEGFRLLAVTLLGDAFLEAPDGSVVLLATSSADVRSAAPSPAAFHRAVAARELPACTEAASTFQALADRGVTLPPGHCFSHSLPLVVGGEPELANLEPTDLTLHFSLLGQLHRQARRLPDGMRIARFE